MAIVVHTRQNVAAQTWTTEVRLSPLDKEAAKHIALMVRVPIWASGVKSVHINDQNVSTRIEDGYLAINRELHKRFDSRCL